MNYNILFFFKKYNKSIIKVELNGWIDRFDMKDVVQINKYMYIIKIKSNWINKFKKNKLGLCYTYSMQSTFCI
jgi:hypothetical protein